MDGFQFQDRQRNNNILERTEVTQKNALFQYVGEFDQNVTRAYDVRANMQSKDQTLSQEIREAIFAESMLKIKQYKKEIPINEKDRILPLRGEDVAKMGKCELDKAIAEEKRKLSAIGYNRSFFKWRDKDTVMDTDTEKLKLKLRESSMSILENDLLLTSIVSHENVQQSQMYETITAKYDYKQNVNGIQDNSRVRSIPAGRRIKWLNEYMGKSGERASELLPSVFENIPLQDFENMDINILRRLNPLTLSCLSSDVLNKITECSQKIYEKEKERADKASNRKGRLEQSNEKIRIRTEWNEKRKKSKGDDIARFEKTYISDENERKNVVEKLDKLTSRQVELEQKKRSLKSLKKLQKKTEDIISGDIMSENLEENFETEEDRVSFSKEYGLLRHLRQNAFNKLDDQEGKEQEYLQKLRKLQQEKADYVKTADEKIQECERTYQSHRESFHKEIEQLIQEVSSKISQESGDNEKKYQKLVEEHEKCITIMQKLSDKLKTKKNEEEIEEKDENKLSELRRNKQSLALQINTLKEQLEQEKAVKQLKEQLNTENYILIENNPLFEKLYEYKSKLEEDLISISANKKKKEDRIKTYEEDIKPLEDITNEKNLRQVGLNNLVKDEVKGYLSERQNDLIKEIKELSEQIADVKKSLKKEYGGVDKAKKKLPEETKLKSYQDTKETLQSIEEEMQTNQKTVEKNNKELAQIGDSYLFEQDNYKLTKDQEDIIECVIHMRNSKKMVYSDSYVNQQMLEKEIQKKNDQPKLTGGQLIQDEILGKIEESLDEKTKNVVSRVLQENNIVLPSVIQEGAHTIKVISSVRNVIEDDEDPLETIKQLYGLVSDAPFTTNIKQVKDSYQEFMGEELTIEKTAELMYDARDLLCDRLCDRMKEAKTLEYNYSMGRAKVLNREIVNIGKVLQMANRQENGMDAKIVSMARNRLGNCMEELAETGKVIHQREEEMQEFLHGQKSAIREYMIYRSIYDMEKETLQKEEEAYRKSGKDIFSEQEDNREYDQINEEELLDGLKDQEMQEKGKRLRKTISDKIDLLKELMNIDGKISVPDIYRHEKEITDNNIAIQKIKSDLGKYDGVQNPEAIQEYQELSKQLDALMDEGKLPQIPIWEIKEILWKEQQEYRNILSQAKLDSLDDSIDKENEESANVMEVFERKIPAFRAYQSYADKKGKSANAEQQSQMKRDEFISQWEPTYRRVLEQKLEKAQTEEEKEQYNNEYKAAMEDLKNQANYMF